MDQNVSGRGVRFSVTPKLIRSVSTGGRRAEKHLRPINIHIMKAQSIWSEISGRDATWRAI